jgi:hypothetical protein
MSEASPLPIVPPPGVVLTESERTVEGRWILSSNVRFVKGRPQKIGGNLRITDEPTSGQPRASHAWRDNVQNNYFAVGTYRKLYVYDSSWLQNDITPFRDTGTLAADPFANDGTINVAVEDAGHGVSVGDTVVFEDAAIFNGIDMNGSHIVTTVQDADNYVIQLAVRPDSYTKVLLHMDGANGGTVFTDSNLGGSAHTWAAGGTGVTATSTPKFGTAALNCGAAAGWCETANHADFAPGSGNFSCEIQFNRQGGSGTRRIMFGQATAAGASIPFYIELTAANVAHFVVVTDTGTYGVTGTTAFAATGYHHVLGVRVGDIIRLFVDGVQEGGDVACTGTVIVGTSKFSVGRLGELVTLGWNGFLDEFRLSIGSARWTSNFTAPVIAYEVASGGGAAVDYSYEISIGPDLGAYGYGYGVGGYGLDTYGTARDSSSVFTEPRIWSLDHFGELLFASYNGGSIYLFDPTASQPWGRAELISADPGLPTDCRAMFITPERFVFALCTGMQVKWCTQGDYEVWTPATGNTANIRTLTEGTKLVGGKVLSDFISLVWTDAALYRFQYTGATYVYNSSMVAKDCGLLSPGAAVTVGGEAFWMGQDTFWRFSGAVAPMPNVEDIRKYIYDRVDINLGYQCSATYWPQHNEVVFFITEDGDTAPGFGVLYSIENQCWAPLDFGRCSGSHFTQGDTRPYMCDSDGYIYQHEVGYDDNGVAMPWSLQLAAYAMNEGGAHMDVEFLIPDFKDQVGDIEMVIDTYDYLNDSTFEDTETETIAATDSGAIDFRVSGRYIGILASGDGLGCYFRWGKPVLWLKPSGKR